jgi:hypothetical protein
MGSREARLVRSSQKRETLCYFGLDREAPFHTSASINAPAEYRSNLLASHSSYGLLGIFSQFDKYGMQIFNGAFQLNNCLTGVNCRLEQRFAVSLALIL